MSLTTSCSNIAALSVVCAALAQATPAGNLIATFTNAAPTDFAWLGWSVATLGSNRILVGVPGYKGGLDHSGAVFLFDTNSTQLLSVTNPVPKAGAAFGETVCALGEDRIVIGDRFADLGGAAYLFNASGNLLSTFTNPAPASVLGFGSTIATLGESIVMITGYDGYESDFTNSGGVYLFNTNGSLTGTLTNPHSGNNFFGWSVAAVLGDKVIVGAPWDDTGAVHAGAAWVFSTNGTLLTTITNPTPSTDEMFGYSIAAVGVDRVLVTALWDDLAGENSGAAYLFTTEGELLARFLNPFPVANSQFGSSVAVVDGESVIIGALEGPLAGTYTGAAYLFNTNGVLQGTFTNPLAAL